MESDHLAKRLQQSKEEVIQLETELQKLLNEGLKIQTQTKNYDLVNSQSIQQQSSIATTNDSKKLITETKRAPSASSSVTKRKDENISKPETIVSPKKVRHYDRKEAREYIRKQRELRLQATKLDNQKKIEQQLSRKKLQELDQKASKLLALNLQHKRERSRSRENQNAQKSNAQLTFRDDVLVKPSNTTTSKTVPDLIPNGVSSNNVNRNSRKKISSTDASKVNKNITCRPKENEHVDGTLEFISKVAEKAVERQKAAVKIQAYFRGYKCRKIYQQLIKQKLEEQEKNRLKVPAQVLSKEIPVWLQRKPTVSHPYNFINSVKRKLNFAINKGKTVTEVGVQNSTQNSSKDESVKSMTRQEIKEILENSVKSVRRDNDLQSYASHKLPNSKINEDVIASQHNNEQAVENKSQNTKSENKKPSSQHPYAKYLLGEINKNSSQAYSSIIPSKSVDRHEKRSQYRESDSDTSKNIPDLSSETDSIKTTSNLETDKVGSDIESSKLKIDMERLKHLRLEHKSDNFHIERKNNVKSKNKQKSNVKPKKAMDNITIRSPIDVAGSEEPSLLSVPSVNLRRLSTMPEQIFGTHDLVISSSMNLKIPQNVNKSPSHSDNASGINTNRLSKESTEKSIKILSGSHMLLKDQSNRSHKSSTNSSIISSSSNFPLLKSARNSKSELGITNSQYNHDSVNSILSEQQISIEENVQSNHQSASESAQEVTELKAVENGRSESFKSIHTGTVTGSEPYSTNFTAETTSTYSSLPSLKHPSISLRRSTEYHQSIHGDVRTIAMKSGEKAVVETKCNSNQIHLKFEAELHLLNDFNESLRQFMEVEKSLLELQSKKLNENTSPRGQTNKVLVLQNNETQTSVPTNSSSQAKQNESRTISENIAPLSINPSINYSRPSEIGTEASILIEGQSFINTDDEFSSVNLELSKLHTTVEPSTMESINNLTSFKENIQGNIHVGLSLGVFEQLIKEEDARIENLKTILNIREKALLDRFKGELAWLKIQMRHYRETGQIREMSMVKKKQRGIIIKLQHETQEMHRLKQMQKQASEERKTFLKQQRNMIKEQLSNPNSSTMLSKLKKSSSKERSSSGPLKVYSVHSHTETIRSETSISRRSSVIEEIVDLNTDTDEKSISRNSAPVSAQISKLENAKRTLLMREAVLQKRRKAAEELLQWHQRLLEEERKIAELEMAASSIINQVHTPNMEPNPEEKVHKFNGEQLNILWSNMTGREEKKFNDGETYSLNHLALEQFCKDAKTIVSEHRTDNKSDRIHSNSLESAKSNLSERVPVLKNDLQSSESIANSKNLLSTWKDHSFIQNSINTIVNVESVPDSQELDSSNNQIDISSRQVPLASKLKESCANKISSEENSKITNSVKNISHKNVQNHISKHSDSESENDIVSSKKVASNGMTIMNGETISHDTVDNTLEEHIKSVEGISIDAESNDGHAEISIKDIIAIDNELSNSTSTILEEEEDIKVDSDKEYDREEIKTAEPEVRTEIEDNLKKVTSYSKTDSTSISEQLSEDRPPEMKKSIDNESQGIETATSHQTMTEIVDTSKPIEIIDEVDEDKSLENQKPESNETITPKTIQISIKENHVNDDEITSYVSERSKQVTLPDLSYGYVETHGKNSSVIEELDNNVSASEIGEKISDVLMIEKPTIAENITENSNIIEKLQVSSQLENLSIKSNIAPDEPGEIEANEKSDSTSRISNYTISTFEEKIDSKSNDTSLKSTIPEEENSLGLSQEESVSTDLSKESEPKTKSAQSGDSHHHTNVDNTVIDNIIETSVKEDTQETSKSQPSKESEVEIEELVSTGTSKSVNSSSDDGSNEIEEKITPPHSNHSTSLASQIDVKKRVSEILADSQNTSRGDRSPRLQDLYITTYDVMSPEHSPESGSPVNIVAKFGDEAEELFKKQLAIEQEIKALEQQQKEQIPYIYMREIPNKPPPPYTPPAFTQTPAVPSVLPTGPEQVDLVVENIIGILYSAHLNGTLHTATISEETIKFLINGHNIEKDSFLLVFNLCKESAVEHYKQFENESGPIWMRSKRKNKLSVLKPSDKNTLEKLLKLKVKQLIGFEKVYKKENMIIKWSQKKRDHVDELLVSECQAEESEWTNYAYDEHVVMRDVTNDIMNMLISESASAINEAFNKKSYFC